MKIQSLLFAALVAVAAPVVQAQSVPESAGQITLSFAPVVRQAAPAVVNIYASRIVQERSSPFAGDPFFDQFFKDFGTSQPRVQNSLGSGVIISDDGIVVSNYHVVSMATDIRVVLNDRREFGAEVMLADEASDLAVLRLKDASDLPSLSLRDSNEVEVGELVLAIGNPFGIGQTVSSGIVSGLARSGVSVGDGRGYFIQTDAAINPGNSGGALVDVSGRLVGINTAILTRSGGSNGIGFAIPSNLVRNFVDQAKAGQDRFQRPWAGVSGQAVDATVAEAMQLARPDGVVLSELHEASPFRKAGLRPGDIVLALGDEPVNSPQEMIFRMSSMGIGNSIEVDYLRNGKVAQATVDLAAAPDMPPSDPRHVVSGGLRGLSVARINPAVIAEYGLPLLAEGVVVTGVDDLAARAGFRPGDVLVAINGAEVSQTADVVAAAQEKTRNWEVALMREGRRVRLRFRL